jgi:hypothetical protein
MAPAKQRVNVARWAGDDRRVAHAGHVDDLAVHRLDGGAREIAHRAPREPKRQRVSEIGERRSPMRRRDGHERAHRPSSDRLYRATRVEPAHAVRDDVHVHVTERREQLLVRRAHATEAKLGEPGESVHEDDVLGTPRRWWQQQRRHIRRDRPDPNDLARRQPFSLVPKVMVGDPAGRQHEHQRERDNAARQCLVTSRWRPSCRRSPAASTRRPRRL